MSLTKILAEGYGSGAWHGPDMKAALMEVPDAVAVRRPAPGRHNIAEIAVHHAFYVHSVRGRLLGTAIEPFVFEGEDWFEVELPWPKVQALVEQQYGHLASVVSDIAAGHVKSSLSDDEVFQLVLGITCHAVYHAGQIQLIKRLAEG
jgi:DinB superfamily